MPAKKSALGLPELLCLAGLGSVGYGLWRWSPPLMFVVVGAVVLAVGVLLGRK